MKSARWLAGVVVLGLMAAAPAAAQDDVRGRIEALLQQGDELVVAGVGLHRGGDVEAGAAKVAAGLAKYADMFEVLGKFDTRRPDELQYAQHAYYNTACARAIQGRTEQALDAFERLLSAGFDLWIQLNKDSDLDGIRDQPRFKEALTLAKDAQKIREYWLEQLEKKESLFPFALKVTTLEGKQVSLADLRGKVVLVNVWGTFYRPYDTELKHLRAVERMFDGRVAVVGLAWEDGEAGAEAKARVAQAAKECGVTYPVALLGDRAVLDQIPNLATFPTTLFVDRAGRVRFQANGALDRPTHWLVSRLLDLEEAE